MGIADMFYGRSAKARERRAAKVRNKYADVPGMTPELLEPLAQSADMPSRDRVALYLEAVPAGAEPRRVLHGAKVYTGTSYVGVLFDSGLTMRWGGYGGIRGTELEVHGADLPFGGMQKVEIFSHEGDDGILVSGSDGTNDYSIGCLGFDPQDVQEFAQATVAARDQFVQPASPDINIDSSLPPEQQLAALEQMRSLGAIPEDLYAATAAKIRASSH
ncbi:hypothetical protein [Agrococcus casei]|uniref:hypothetical protein n=1 Tax=Agrococcus casei TaxID=343512 RepID=UPI003F91B229